MYSSTKLCPSTFNHSTRLVNGYSALIKVSLALINISYRPLSIFVLRNIIVHKALFEHFCQKNHSIYVQMD